MDTKNISLNTYFNPIPTLTDSDDPYHKILHILHKIFKNFMNESNFNNKTYAQNALLHYQYIRSEYTLPKGKYIRWINKKDPYDLKLRVGGIIIDDNGKIIIVRANNKNFSILKKNIYTFLKIK